VLAKGYPYISIKILYYSNNQNLNFSWNGRLYAFIWASLMAQLVGKESTCNVGELGSIPVLGRSPGGGHGNPLQYSCLESPMDRGAGRLLSMGSQRDGHDWVTNTLCTSYSLVDSKEAYLLLIRTNDLYPKNNSKFSLNEQFAFKI